MDAERRYRFPHNSRFNLDTAVEYIHAHRFRVRTHLTLGDIGLEVSGPPGADLTILDEKLIQLGATPPNPNPEL